MNTSFNINEWVKVKLTEAGKHELRRQRQESLGDFPSILSSWDGIPNTDDEGYSKFQMWDLMGRLGHMCGMAHELPFETKIVLCTK